MLVEECCRYDQPIRISWWGCLYHRGLRDAKSVPLKSVSRSSCSIGVSQGSSVSPGKSPVFGPAGGPALICQIISKQARCQVSK